MGDSFSVAGDKTETHHHYERQAVARQSAAPLVAGILGGAGLGAAAALAWALMGQPDNGVAAQPTEAAAVSEDTRYQFGLNFPE